MAQYCPLLGQIFAIAGHKVMRREKIFGRSTIVIRNMLSGCRKRGFAREKPYSQFYPSPFTFSPENPINTGVVRGEGLAQPFTTLHPHNHLCIRYLYHISEGWRVFLKVAFYPPAAWNFNAVFSTTDAKILFFSIFPQLAGLILINRLWLPESRRRYPSHLLEELGEMGLRGEAEGVGYLLHSMRSGG